MISLRAPVLVSASVLVAIFVVPVSVVLEVRRRVPWGRRIPLWTWWAQRGRLLRALLGLCAPDSGSSYRSAHRVPILASPIVLYRDACEAVRKQHAEWNVGMFVTQKLSGYTPIWTNWGCFPENNPFWLATGDWLLLPNPKMGYWPQGDDGGPGMRRHGFLYTAWCVHPEFQACWFGKDSVALKDASPSNVQSKRGTFGFETTKAIMSSYSQKSRGGLDDVEKPAGYLSSVVDLAREHAPMLRHLRDEGMAFVCGLTKLDPSDVIMTVHCRFTQALAPSTTLHLHFWPVWHLDNLVYDTVRYLNGHSLELNWVIEQLESRGAITVD